MELFEFELEVNNNEIDNTNITTMTNMTGTMHNANKTNCHDQTMHPAKRK